MIYDWDDNKNEFLKQEREISFEEIVINISEGKVVDILDHPNKAMYPHQKVYLVNRENYIFCVPFVEDKRKGLIFLKTIFPSRKYTKQYLSGEAKK